MCEMFRGKKEENIMWPTKGHPGNFLFFLIFYNYYYHLSLARNYLGLEIHGNVWKWASIKVIICNLVLETPEKGIWIDFGDAEPDKKEKGRKKEFFF